MARSQKAGAPKSKFYLCFYLWIPTVFVSLQVSGVSTSCVSGVQNIFLTSVHRTVSDEGSTSGIGCCSHHLVIDAGGNSGHHSVPAVTVCQLHTCVTVYQLHTWSSNVIVNNDVNTPTVGAMLTCTCHVMPSSSSPHMSKLAIYRAYFLVSLLRYHGHS